METPVIVTVIKEKKISLITRKSTTKLTHRAIQNSAQRIIASTEMLYGVKRTPFYLEAALIKLKKRKIDQNDSVVVDVVVDDDNNDDNNDGNSDRDEEENLIIQ